MNAPAARAASAARRSGGSRRASDPPITVPAASAERAPPSMDSSTRRAAYRVLRADPVMAGLIAAAGRYQIEPLPDRPPFESLARAIAHQQLHRAAAESILARL